MSAPGPTPQQIEKLREVRDAMMARARKRGRRKLRQYRLHAALLFPLLGLLRLMPVDMASAAGGWVGRNIVARQLKFPTMYRTVRVPFPDMNDREIDALLTAMAENIGRVAGEMVHLGAFAGPDNPRLTIKGRERLEPALRSGKGILFLGGHFANWEMGLVALRSAGLDGATAMQHPTNPFVVEWLGKLRYRYGLSEQIGSGDGVYQAFRRRLKAGQVAAMLVDQRVGHGIKVPFFGLETNTNLMPARLARDLGIPVVMISNRRLKGAHFEIEVHEPIYLQQGPDRAAEEKAFMARINAFFEHQIRQAPSDWLWGHPRWDDVFQNIGPHGQRL